jgi:hypothetical protein
MKIESRQLIKILQLAFPLVLSCALILSAAVAADDYVYPTPENHSAFIKSYTPADVIAPFSLGGSQLSGPGGSSAGRGCVFHEKGFQAWLVIAPGKEPALMAAVRQDLKTRLLGEGVHIVRERGNTRKGFRFDYSTGKSEGSVLVDPLTFVDPVTVTGPGFRPGEVVGIILRLQITETWYKTTKKPCGKL